MLNALEYTDWLSGLSKRFRQSQIKAAMAVNVELLKFYWSLGADILRMEKDQPWGSSCRSYLPTCGRRCLRQSAFRLIICIMFALFMNYILTM